MSNPWAEVYKDFRSELLGEEDLQERRRLMDVKTASQQGKYDLKSKVAKMRAAGKSSSEIQAWVDNYLRNSKLPGQEKMKIRQTALNAGFEPEGEMVDEGAANLIRAGLAAGTALAGMAVANKAKEVGGKIQQRNKKQKQQIDQLLNQEVEIDGDDIQEKAPPGAKYERMVKHIKKGYSKGGLTKKERSIAYATAWKEKNRNEEFVMEEEGGGSGDFVVVRITKENGQIFEKKVPASKVDELRKRYKSVVVVGSKEKKGSMKAEDYEYIEEKKMKKSKKLDPVGKEDGDIDNDGDKDETDSYLLNRRKVRSRAIRGESYSDWRYEMQLDEDELGLTAAEMRTAGEKKNKENGESFSDVTECGDSHWGQKVNSLAEELGGQVLDYEILDENVGKVVQQALKTIIKHADKLDDVTIKPYVKGGPLAAPAKGGKPATGVKPGALAKPETKGITKPEEIQQVKVRDITKEKPGQTVKVDLDAKTGTIVKAEPQVKTQTLPQTQTQTQTQTKTQTQTPVKTIPPGPSAPGPRRLPSGGLRLPIAVPKIGIEEPKNIGSVVRV